MPMETCEVLVVGAGPVGLLLANRLGQQGIACVVVDRASGPPSQSMAIGITPPSLDILRGLDLDRPFIQHGVPVNRAYVYEEGRLLGCVSFDDIPSRWPFILSLPQRLTVHLLESSLARWPCVRLRWNTELLGCQEDGRPGGRLVADTHGHGADRGGFPGRVRRSSQHRAQPWRGFPPPSTATAYTSRWPITRIKPAWAPRRTSSSAARGPWNRSRCPGNSVAGSC